MNATQTLSCSNCGAPLPTAETPTLTCQYCGTAMVNPFHQKAGSTPPNLAMPQINITVSNVIGGTAQSVSGVPSFSAPTTSAPRSWWVTVLLALFFGVFGAHRFYTGHIVFGLIQLFTFGGFGIWWVVDLLLLVSGNYHDKHGRALQPPSRMAVFVVLGLMLLLCLAIVALPGSGSAPPP